MIAKGVTMLPKIHVGSLNVANPKVGFPYVLGPTGENAIPSITDLTEVVSLTHNMKRPDGTELTGLPVSIVSQSPSAIVASYIFRSQDLAEDPTDRFGQYWGYLVGEMQDGTTFETAEAILPVVERYK